MTPSLQPDLQAVFPEYARDVPTNLATLLGERVLTETQRLGCLIASASATGASEAMELAGTLTSSLSPELRDAAKAAAVITQMNDVYYRALHMLDDPEYRGLRSLLAMQALNAPAADRLDFTLWCACVSAVDGCEPCLRAHVRELHAHGATVDQVHAAIRIAAVMKAAARALTMREADR